MAKKNKGGSSSKRAMAQRARQGVKEAERQKQKSDMAIVFEAMGDMTLEHAHQTLLLCLRSVELSMEENGIPIPTYIEHRVSEVKCDMSKDVTFCKRCRFNCVDGEDDLGKYGHCRLLLYADTLKPVLTCNDDCCGFGLLRREYIK